MALRRKKEKAEPEKDQPDKPWTREDFLRDLRKVARVNRPKTGDDQKGADRS